MTLYAADRQVRDEYSARLQRCSPTDTRSRSSWHSDGEALTELRNGTAEYVNKVHFGYTDGISGMAIRGGPETPVADHQQACEAVVVRAPG